MTADCWVLSLLGAESSDFSYHSLLCSPSAHWSNKLGRGQAQLALAVSHMLRDRASCQPVSRVDPDNIVWILPEPAAALPHQLIVGNSLLSADSGPQGSKRCVLL